jgi:hypothetical protein
VQFIKKNPVGNFKQLLTTPMLILANIADDTATQNMKELLDHGATLKYQDAYAYYSQIYKTIHTIDQTNAVKEANLVELHTNLFLFSLKRFIENKDIYIPQLTTLINDKQDKKVASTPPSEEEKNLQDLKNGLENLEKLKDNFFAATKNLLKADHQIHGSSYQASKTLLEETPVKELIDASDKALEYITILMGQITQEQADANIHTSTRPLTIPYVSESTNVPIEITEVVTRELSGFADLEISDFI